MSCVKNRFESLFRKNKKTSISNEKPLFRLIPWTQLGFLVAGIVLFNPTRKRHVVWSFLTILLRLWLCYSYVSERIKTSSTIETMNEFTFYSFAYGTYILLVKKKSKIVHFLSSEPLSAVNLRKVDLLCVAFYLGSVLLTTIPVVESPILFESNKKMLLGSLFTSCPIIRTILCILFLALFIFWFQLSPLCSTTYALGYTVLYSYKVNALNCISANLHQMSHQSLILKLKEVKSKQKQFESIFGPLLFIVLCNNFLATIYFFLILKLMISEAGLIYYNYCLYYIAYCVLIVTTCIGLIFYIAHYNGKIKDLSDEVSEQIEAKSGEHLHSNYLLVNYLQRKVNKSINDPLTACGMVNVDRQIVLGIAASCVSFSVLLIQINNGALNS